MSLRRERAGVFVTDWREFSPAYATFLHTLGFRWAAFHGHEGERDPEPYGVAPFTYVETIRAAGLEPLCWGSFSADNPAKRPIQSAIRASRAVAQLGAQAYIPNIEVEYDDRQFLRQWRLLRPAMTTWLCSGITDPRDWPAWFKRGGIIKRYPAATAWLPECYMNVNPNARPIEALFWAIRPGGHGIPADQVKPLLGCYDPRFPVVDYVNELREAAQLGFSVYHAGSVTSGELATFGAAISSGLAAV